MNDDTFLVFGTSPFIGTILDKIPRLLNEYHNCGVNHPTFDYEFLAFGDVQTFNPEFKNKLIVPSYLDSLLKTRCEDGINSYIGNDYILKPHYLSPNEYPLSMFYPIEYAQTKGFKRVVLIACEAKTDKHYHNNVFFNKNQKQLDQINELLKSFEIEILQANKDSNLNLQFIDIEGL